MKHHILAGFRSQVVHRELLMLRAGQIFGELETLPGVESVEMCPATEDGMDFHIVITLHGVSVTAIQETRPYSVFRAEFGPLLEKTETFDEC